MSVYDIIKFKIRTGNKDKQQLQVRIVLREELPSLGQDTVHRFVCIVGHLHTRPRNLPTSLSEARHEVGSEVGSQHSGTIGELVIK